MPDHQTQPASVSTSLLLDHHPLLLTEGIWRIQSGVALVFAVAVQAGTPQGMRRYLCSVDAGELMIGTIGSGYGVIAVGQGQAQVVQLQLADLKTLLHAGKAEDLSNRWLTQLKTGIQTLYPAASLPPLQIAPGLDSDPQVFLDHLYQFQGQLLEEFARQDHQQNQIDHQRLTERHRLNQQVTAVAVDHLKGVIAPRSDLTISPTDPPLMQAVKVIGNRLGVEMRAPSTGGGLEQLSDPVEAIARASHLRLRRVKLRGEWWRQDNGPLLAFQRSPSPSSEHRSEAASQDPSQDISQPDPKWLPIALVPVAPHRYRLYDPQSQSYRSLDPQQIERMDPTAYLFYKPLPTAGSGLGSLLGFALQGHRRDLLTLAIAGLAIAVLGMITPQVTGILVDVAIPDSDRGLVLQLGLGLGAAAFGSLLFRLAQGLALTRVETGMESSLQAGVWDRILRLPPQFFRHYSMGDLLQRVSSPGQIRQILAANSLLTLVSSGFSVLYLALLAYYSFTLAGLAALLALGVAILTALSGRILIGQTRSLLELQGKLSSLMVELINGVTKLQIAGAEPRAFGYWATHYTQQIRYRLNRQIVQDALVSLTTVIPTLTSALIFAVTIHLITQDSGEDPAFTTGEFLAFNSALGIFMQGMLGLSRSLITTLELIPIWERAQPILQVQPEVSEHKIEPGVLTGQIALEQVSFRYHDSGPLTLDGISLHADPGEFIAIVGPSGSGKSTLFRLILGFESPAQGQVRIEGRDLAGLDLEAVRQQIGVVLQQNRIPSGSLHEIVAGGALVTQVQVWGALALAGLAEDIQGMPMGIHTMFGEGAPTLSGGQRQRLMIARALVNQPKILLLDEATSSLDNRTQSIVSENLGKLKSTRIVIAHRLSTIQGADRIYVLQKGTVVQQGPFDQLAQTPGLFQDLISRQIT